PAAALTKAYVTLTDLAPLLTTAGAGKTAGVLFDKEHPTTHVHFGDLVLNVSTDYTFEWASTARHDPVWPRGGGLIVQIAPDEFIVAGNGIIVTFAAAAGVHVAVARVHECRSGAR